MPRITLAFRLSTMQAQRDLLQEFSLHHGVEAVADEVAGTPILRVTSSDAAPAMWDVRATVGIFDDRATELASERETGQG